VGEVECNEFKTVKAHTVCAFANVRWYMPVYPCNKAEVEKHLLDFTGSKPEGIVYDTIHMMMQTHERYLGSMDREILEDFPANEMYLQSDHTVEPDWQSIWNAARKKLGSASTASLATSKDGPYIARKKDRIWQAISRFKRPYPPFEFGSSMWLRDADDTLAKSLGVI